MVVEQAAGKITSKVNSKIISPEKVKNIQERILQLEEQKAKLIEARKIEIAETVIKAGGIGLDNRLLAGFVAFASNEANKHSGLLTQMKEVAATLKMPSRRAK